MQPTGGIPISVRVFLLAVFMVPVQVETGGLSRISPTDMLLAGLLVATPGLIVLRSRFIDLLPLLLLATLSLGTLLALVSHGNATNHTVTVKLAGGFVLALLAIVTATFARAGWAGPIIRAFLAGMIFWGAVAYVDWKFVDIVPFLDSKTRTRFGGMQFDPNNAGAGYGVAVLLAWRLGEQLYSSRLVRLAVLASCAWFMAITLSRGAYIATAAAVLLVLLVERRSMQRSLRFAAAVGVLIVGAFLSGVVTEAIDDFERRPDNIAGRSEIVDRGLADFEASNGFGIGLGVYREAHDAIIHNTALWFLVEMSIWGLGFLVLMAWIPARSAIQLRTFAPQLGVALLGAHAVMLVTSTGIEALYQRPWWIVVGLIAGCVPRAIDLADRRGELTPNEEPLRGLLRSE